jgi:hypothetical protein
LIFYLQLECFHFLGYFRFLGFCQFDGWTLVDSNRLLWTLKDGKGRNLQMIQASKQESNPKNKHKKIQAG